jgi:hypothetical protein
MTFRLRTILWVFALFAAALATFGILGVFGTIPVIWFWFLVFKRSPISLVHILIFIAILGSVVGLLLPAPKFQRWSGERCRHKLENLGESLLVYDKENQGLPGDQWRMFLLPYLSTNASSEQIDQDSELPAKKSSRALSSVAAYDYVCSIDHSSIKHATSYFAVVDSRCAWSSDAENSLSEIVDNPSHTIQILEAHNQNVAWTDSKNFSFDEAFQLLTAPASQTDSCHWRELGFFEKSTWVRNVLFADGTVRSLNMPLSRELAVALLTANGGEAIDPFELARISNPELDYKKVYSLAIFVSLSLLPTLNLRQRRRVDAEDSGDASHRQLLNK